MPTITSKDRRIAASRNSPTSKYRYLPEHQRSAGQSKTEIGKFLKGRVEQYPDLGPTGRGVHCRSTAVTIYRDRPVYYDGFGFVSRGIHSQPNPATDHARRFLNPLITSGFPLHPYRGGMSSKLADCRRKIESSVYQAMRSNGASPVTVCAIARASVIQK